MRPHPFGKPSGQIAAFFVVLLAVLMLLIMVVINVGQVGLHKTLAANATDTAALSIASSLGSLAREASLRLGDGKKYEDEDCDIAWDLIGKILAVIVLIVITVICWGTCAGFTGPLIGTLTVLAIAGAVAGVASVNLDAFVFKPAIARHFNKQFAKLNNLKDQIRENAIVTVLNKMADDPHTVADTNDINENCTTNPPPAGDPCVTEQVPAFADWYDRRLAVLVGIAQGNVAGAIGNATALRTSLQNLRDGMKTFESDLDTKALPVFEWIEVAPPLGLGIPLAYWEPGSQPTTGGAPCSTAQDQAECIRTRVQELIGLIDNLLALDDASLVAGGSVIEEPLNDIMSEVQGWVSLIDAWISDLNVKKSLIPWPPDLTVSCTLPTNTSDCAATWVWGSIPPWVITCTAPGNPLDCTVTGQNPAVLPPPAVLALLSSPNQHPIDLVTEALANAEAAIQTFAPAAINITLPDVSVDDPTYSWQDHRGWHHVKVKVGGFSIPKLKATFDPFSHPNPISGFLPEQCVKLKHGNQNISVEAWRWDQDKVISNGWTMRYRMNAASAQPCDASITDATDPASCGNPALVDTGIYTKSVAHHGYKPNTVGIIESR